MGKICNLKSLSKKKELVLSVLKNQKEKSKVKSIPVAENGISAKDLILKYCDNIDYLLLFVGFVASLAAAAIYPLMFLMYGEVAGTFIDLEKYKILNNAPNDSLVNQTLTNISNSSTISKWYVGIC
jgi:hypothetical protein